ncbi:MAG: hypothetical protein F4081_02435, partial [Dehalococcoidia bacterium]|nr:hypothetical protein [Dehalococcoidia bacterium]
MKRLDEILPSAAAATPETELQDPPPAPADEPGEDDCSRCGGAGFVRRERALDDPRFGRAEPCSCVLDEAGEVRRSRLERISNLGALTRFTFETLGEDAPSVTARVRAYAAEPDGWLVLKGASGSYKTHLAAAIANERIARGEPVLFRFTPDLLDELRASYEPADGEPGFDTLFELVRTAPLLILDDIDAAASSEWAREKLFQLINARYNAALPTVCTCYSLTESLDERLSRRLASGTVLDLSGGAPLSRYRQIGGMTRERLEDFGFHNFHTRFPNYATQENESLQTAWESAHRFADSPEGWMLILGESGCGKTHLAAAVANAVLRNGDDAFFAVVPDLLDHLRASFAPNRGDPGYDELFDDIRNAGLLVLDDLGPQTSSSWAIEKLFQIANYRASSRLPTIITAALSLDELREAHPRVAVRALDPKLSQHVAILARPY